MRDRGVIWTGLAVFVGLLVYPVWHNLFAGVTAKGPNPVLPVAQKQCVEPREAMRKTHMALLLSWRDTAIRQGIRDYATPDGRHFNISLNTTCLRQCHTDRGEFCDRCHNYEAVSVPCWDCHLDSKTALGVAR